MVISTRIFEFKNKFVDDRRQYGTNQWSDQWNPEEERKG